MRLRSPVVAGLGADALHRDILDRRRAQIKQANSFGTLPRHALAESASPIACGWPGAARPWDARGARFTEALDDGQVAAGATQPNARRQLERRGGAPLPRRKIDHGLHTLGQRRLRRCDGLADRVEVIVFVVAASTEVLDAQQSLATARRRDLEHPGLAPAERSAEPVVQEDRYFPGAGSAGTSKKKAGPASR